MEPVLAGLLKAGETPFVCGWSWRGPEPMQIREPLPVVMISGLLASARLYADQIPALWRFGPVTVADHTRDDSMAAIAARILSDAPPAFALVGLSMGGYISLEIMRQASGRVRRLALLDTSARPDRPDQTERRRAQIEAAREGRLEDVADQQYPLIVDRSRRDDSALRAMVKTMALEVGAKAFNRQQAAIIGRADSRPEPRRHRLPDPGARGRRRPAGFPLSTPRSLPTESRVQGWVVVPACGHLSTLEQPRRRHRRAGGLDQRLEGVALRRPAIAGDFSSPARAPLPWRDPAWPWS